MAMRYIEMLKQFVIKSVVYQELLKKLPAPFNNPYFDTLVLIFIVLYILYRIMDMIRVKRYRAKIRKQQKLENKRETRRNEELEKRERVLSEREERIGRFMDYLEMIFRNRTRKQETNKIDQTYANTYSDPYSLQQHEYLLEDGGGVDKVSEYDLVLDEMSKEDLKHSYILKRQEASRRKAEQRMLDLEKENQMEKGMEEHPAAPERRRWKKVAKDGKKKK